MMGRPALAGRPICAIQQVRMDATPPMLRRGDAALALPRLGGMARPDGVVIVSERFWAFAGVDGSIREGQMPKPPEAVHNLPLARGLVRLGASLSPMFRRRGRREAPRACPDPGRGAGADPLRVHRLALVDDRRHHRLARSALHHPARPSAAPARRGAPRDRRCRGAPSGRSLGRDGEADALLAALRYELRGARAARHLRRRQAVAARTRVLVAARRPRPVARADDGALADGADVVASCPGRRFSCRALRCSA